MASTQETLDEMNKKLAVLATLATKDDVETLTTVFMDKIEKMEGRIFQLETERDSLKADVEDVKKENVVLKQQIRNLQRTVDKKHNDTEQYSRRWNLRVFGIKESEKENCVEKCLKLFNEKVHVETREEDIQVAHRVPGQPAQQETTGGQRKRRPPAIIVQFESRRIRDKILQNRRVLARSGFVIAEDLTYKNFRLLKAAQDHSATNDAWVTNGKVIALLKNGKKVRVDIDTDLDTFFERSINPR